MHLVMHQHWDFHCLFIFWYGESLSGFDIRQCLAEHCLFLQIAHNASFSHTGC